MATDPPLQVPPALHVNEATLELLERRVEAHVKASFFKGVGAPVGLAGVIAIVYMLFSYIPSHISSYLERDPTFKAGLQSAVNEYLRDPERGQRFVIEQVRAEVTAYFAGPDGKRLVTNEVAESVGPHFKTVGREAIQQQVARHLAGDEVRQLIRDQVTRELQPRVAGLLEPVMKNSLRQVSVVVELEKFFPVARAEGRFEKGTVGELQRQLDSPRGVELRRGDQPIAMTKRIRRGPRYDADVLGFYLDTLEKTFGPRFQHVVSTDADESFLARVEPGLFRRRLAEAREPLMQLLNAEAAEITPDQVQVELGRIFGRPVDAAIAPDVSIRDALRDGLWRRVAAGEAAVLTEGRRFLGTTTRERLLAAVLRPLPG